MGAWLSLRLAEHHRIHANPHFPTPRAWLEDLVGATKTDPALLAWAIAAELPTLLDTKPFAELRQYLDRPPRDEDGTKRLALASEIGRVFSRYAVHRPALVAGWARGEGETWQAVLWRSIAERVGQADLGERAAAFLSAAHAGRDGADGTTKLPERVTLFGARALPKVIDDFVRGLATLTSVNVFLLTASEHPQATAHELVTSLEQTVVLPTGARSLHVDPPGESMLGVLQRDLRAGASATSPLGHVAQRASDASLRVHACHGPMRECEVLRDQILAALAADPALEPRDVIVLCPDLAAYSPLIDAVFGVDRKAPGYLPFRIVDRPARDALPVVEAFFALLDVAASRLTAPQVVDALARGPVMAKLGLDDDDIELVREWVMRSGARWGEDERHRLALGQPALRENTLRFGLDRLLLGVAMSSDGDAMFGGALPYDDIEGATAETLGGFVAFCEGLFDLRGRLAGTATIAVWRDRLIAALSAMVATSRTTEYQHQIIRQSLHAMVEDAANAGFSEPVPLSVVREALDADVGDRGAVFEVTAGAITFASLAAGRCLPAAVVALLGMNDGVFPRRPPALAFDLLASSVEPGDPSPRDEDRHLFLEAILAARRQLIVTFEGRSIRNDAERPPSVVVSELLDAIDHRFAPTQPTMRASDEVVVDHALHPFSPRYFRTDGDPRLFTHSAAFGDGAKSFMGKRSAQAPFAREPVPVREGDRGRPLPIQQLAAFFTHPTKVFVSKRVGVYLGAELSVLEDREPLAFNGLDEFTLGSDLLERSLRGSALAALPDAVRAAGTLPLGAVGRATYEKVRPTAQALAAAVRALLGDERCTPREVDIELGEHPRLVGWLRSVATENQVLYRFAAIRAKHELAAWISHLCMLAMDHGPRETFLVGRSKTKILKQKFTTVPNPAAHLAQLADLYWLGQTAPLPLFPDASLCFAEQRAGGAPADVALGEARSVLAADFDGIGNDYYEKVYAGRDPLDPSFRAFSSTQHASVVPAFAELAERVYGPLIRHRVELA